MTTEYGFSKEECKVIKQQVERRAKLRQEFLKLRTDPCKHSQESGYVFDEALQRFMSMKATHLEFFHTGFKSAVRGLFLVVIPMSVYGGIAYYYRSTFEEQCRTGKIKYRDRAFKLT